MLQRLQQTIDNQFKSQNELRIAENEQKSQKIRNQIAFEIAETEKKKAQEFQEAMKAAIAIRELEINKTQAEKWDGKLPNIVVITNLSNSENIGRMMGIDLINSSSNEQSVE